MNKIKQIDEEKFIAELPNRIAQMQYVPLSDEQLEKAKENIRRSRINARLEGIFLTENEIKLMDIFLEKRLPSDLEKKLLREFMGLSHDE